MAHCIEPFQWMIWRYSNKNSLDMMIPNAISELRISGIVTKYAKKYGHHRNKYDITLFPQLGAPLISNLVTDSVILTLSC